MGKRMKKITMREIHNKHKKEKYTSENKKIKRMS